MFNKVSGNIYESKDGYVIEFKRVEGEKAAFVGKNEEDGTTRLLFILSADGITRKEFLEHMSDNMDKYLEKYVG